MKRKGFTVIEVLTVVIITGILATLAVPPFIRTMDAAKGRLAKTNLRLIYAAERVYRNEIGRYMPYHAGERRAIDNDFKKFLGLDLKENEFEYKVITDGVGFRAIATRAAGKRHGGTTIEINQDGIITSTFPPSP